jgi:response regulator RpfG family c-di-GMP phosphodiesterase
MSKQCIKDKILKSLANQNSSKEEYKTLLEDALNYIIKNDKRCELIVKQSDRNQGRICKLNEELKSYHDKLENKVENNLQELKKLNKELEDTQRDIIFTMGTIGELRSNETGNHVKRVAIYSYILAKKYGLTTKEAKILKEVSPMHDIGKVAIPDYILQKPGKLTKDEFDIMKTHCTLGKNMLISSDRKLMKAASIVAYEHHEKYDGTGYPQGLKGENIHIYGRITAIADVFDALGSDRCYKKAWDDEKIFKLLKEESGKHFDPKLIELFFENLEDFLKVRDKFKDIYEEDKGN